MHPTHDETHETRSRLPLVAGFVLVLLLVLAAMWLIGGAML